VRKRRSISPLYTCAKVVREGNQGLVFAFSSPSSTSRRIWPGRGMPARSRRRVFACPTVFSPLYCNCLFFQGVRNVATGTVKCSMQLRVMDLFSPTTAARTCCAHLGRGKSRP